MIRTALLVLNWGRGINVGGQVVRQAKGVSYSGWEPR